MLVAADNDRINAATGPSKAFAVPSGLNRTKLVAALDIANSLLRPQALRAPPIVAAYSSAFTNTIKTHARDTIQTQPNIPLHANSLRVSTR
jgi:hypothetical protein